MHLSDLHLGKKLNEFSLEEDQKYILQQLIEIAKKERPDCVLIAGDVYDKSIPSADAVVLFDDFLNKLAALKIPMCIISGNHDSAERLAFGARLMTESGVYLANAYNGDTQEVVLHDEYGAVHIFLLPFIKPAIVKHAFPDEAEKITSYNEAVKTAIEHISLESNERNVLMAHQFVTGAITCDSEAVVVGGVDNISAEVFNSFDYVALGHIHSPQNVGNDKVRYCGTPLKYSFSEWQQQKSVTFVVLKDKGMMSVTTLPLTPLRDLRKLRGTYDELMKRDFYQSLPMDSDERLRDFYHLTLTDEDDVPDAVQRLRSVYKNLLQLEYDNKRTRSASIIKKVEEVEHKSPLELMGEFYKQQNNEELDKRKQKYLQDLLEKLGGDEM